jgi:hypothetical protein
LSGGNAVSKKKIFVFAVLFMVICTGTACSTFGRAQKTGEQYVIYISGVQKNEILRYLDEMAAKEYYASRKLLRLNDDYAEILYWGSGGLEVIYNDTVLLLKDYSVTLSNRVIFVEGSAQE